MRPPIRFAPVLVSALWLALFTLACGGGDDGGTPDDRFGVAIVQPGADAVLFPDRVVTLQADLVAPADDVDASTIAYDWSFGDGSTVVGTDGTADHTWQSAGTFTVRVTAREVDEDGDDVAEATATVELTVAPAADLVVGVPTLSIPSTTVTSRDTLRLTVDLENTAGDAPVPFEVGFYVASADAVDPTAPLTVDALGDLLLTGDAIQLDAEGFESLAAGDRANIDKASLAFPEDASSGDYYAFVFADPNDAIGETDEANNASFDPSLFTFVNTSSDGPDLIARNVTARPTRVNQLATVTLDAEIANVGNQPALLTSWAVYLSYGDAELDEDDVLLSTGDLDNVSPENPAVLDDLVLDVDPVATELGEYFVLVVADDGGTVDETDEDNNVGASPRIIVTDEPVPGVDIVIDAFEILPGTTFVDGSVDINATVRNQGTDDVNTQFFCRVFLSPDEALEDGPGGDRVLDTLQVTPLPAGESLEVTRVARIQSFFEPGEYYGFISCDPSFVVAESDEDNNIRALDDTITIADEANIDLEIGEFTIDPLTVDNETNTTVSVEVCNRGSNGSTPSIVRVHISPDPIFDASDTVLLQSRVPPLDPDACLEIRADVPAICDTFQDRYRVFAVADASDSVPELDEENNIAELPEQFTIEGLICDCEDDRFEPNDNLARAAYLNPGVDGYEGLSMCDVATDWYRIPLLRGETVRVVALFDNDRGNLDLTLFGTDRSSVLSRSFTDGDREEVSYFVAPQSGDYYLKVEGRTEDDRNVYDLLLSVSAREEGTDLVALNVSVSPERPVLGADIELGFDVVNLGTTTAGEHTARFFLSNDADIDPVSDTRIGEIVIDEVVDRVTREVTVSLPDDADGGESYIGVFVDATETVDELDEDNNIGVSPVFEIDAECFDAFEPNNTLDTPRLLELATEPPVIFGDLLACSSNRDVYEVCIDDGEFLDILVEFDNADGDIDVRLYDMEGDEVDRSEGIGPEERVGVDYATGESCYRVELYVAGRDREVPYTMTIDAGAAPDELACSRIEEPSDAFGDAVPLRDFLDTDVSICPVEDVDYYRVSLTAGSEVQLRLAPAEGEEEVPGQLRLALFSPSRNFITNTVRADEEIRYTVALNGTHYIRVRSNGDAARSQPYRLEIDGISGVDLVPSDFVVEPEAVAPGDVVRFSFELSNARDEEADAAHYAVWLSSDPVLDEDEDILVREVAIDALAGLATRTEGRRFTVPADLVDGGVWYAILHVDNRGEVEEFVERNNYLLAELVVSPECVPDRSEPNNFAFEAPDAEDWLDVPLTLCGGDVDWYAWSPPSSGSYTISLDFLHADGDLDLYVFEDPTEEPIAVSDGIFDGESVTFPASSTTDYLIYVESFYGDTNEYFLFIE